MKPASKSRGVTRHTGCAAGVDPSIPPSHSLVTPAPPTTCAPTHHCRLQPPPPTHPTPDVCPTLCLGLSHSLPRPDYRFHPIHTFAGCLAQSSHTPTHPVYLRPVSFSPCIYLQWTGWVFKHAQPHQLKAMAGPVTHRCVLWGHPAWVVGEEGGGGGAGGPPLVSPVHPCCRSDGVPACH